MSTGAEPPPQTTVERLRHEFERLIENVWAQGERAADMIGLRPTRAWSPPVDVIELPDSVQVTVDLPGVDPQQIEILLLGNMLTVKGIRPAQVGGPSETCHRRERPSGNFQRSVPLPASVDPNDVRATSRHGMVVITIGKLSTHRPHEVRVQVEPPPPTVTPQM